MNAQVHDSSREDEIRLMQTAQRDLDQFAPLYERYFLRIYHYCLRRVDDEETAEDLTSLIFTRALNSIASYSGGTVAAWLFTIAHNAVVNHYRGRHSQVSFERAEIDLPTGDIEIVESLVEIEQIQALNDLVRSLPQDQQELLALKISGGLTAVEIGAILGKNAGAVRVELHRIIKRLRVLYEEKDRT